MPTMGPVQDWYNTIDTDAGEVMDYHRQIMFPWAFCVASMLGERGLLTPQMLEQFESGVMDAWQNAASFVEFMDWHGMEILNGTAEKNGISLYTRVRNCSYHGR